jgi:hypothetical protein
MVSDPNSEYFEYTMALWNGWVMGVICPHTQLALHDTYSSYGHEPSAEEALWATASRQYITILTLGML